MAQPNLNMCVICLDQIYQPTSLSMCLHTFCWKCIYGKITEHSWKHCPICYANLGENPVEHLRPHHIFEYLKSTTLSPTQEQEDKEMETETETETESETETETDSDME